MTLAEIIKQQTQSHHDTYHRDTKLVSADFEKKLLEAIQSHIREVIGEREPINETSNLSKEGKRKFYRNELRAELRKAFGLEFDI